MKKTHRIPAAEATGVTFPADLDIRNLQDKLRALIIKQYPFKDADRTWFDINALTIAFLVYTDDDDLLWKVEYTLNELNEPVLGNRTKVETQFVAAESRTFKTAESLNGTLTQGNEKSGRVWDVRIITEGPQKNPNTDLSAFGIAGKVGRKVYTAESLLGAVTDKVFEDIPFIVRSDAEHLATMRGGSKDEAKKIGGNFRNVQAAETADGKVTVAAQLYLRNNKPGNATKDFLLKRVAAGESIPYELSWTGDIDGHIPDITKAIPDVIVTKIVDAYSCDPVFAGNAGGMILQAAETASHNTYFNSLSGMITDKKLLACLMRIRAKAAEAGIEGATDTTDTGGMPTTLVDFVANMVWENPSAKVFFKTLDDVKALPEEQLVEIAYKIETAEDTKDTPDAKKAADDAAKAALAATGAAAAESASMQSMRAELDNIKIERTANHLDLALRNSLLPQSYQDKIRKNFTGKAAETAEIDTEIREMKSLAAESGVGGAAIFVTQDAKDNENKSIYGTVFIGASAAEAAEAKKILGYDPTDKSIQRYNGPKEMYMGYTGARGLGTGFGEGGRGILPAAESMSADQLTQIAKDATHVRLLAAYRVGMEKWGWWKNIVHTMPLNDFRAYNAENFGGASDPLQIIATSGDDYPETNITGQESTSITLVERGFIFTINWRDVVNDNVGVITRLPSKLGFGAARQLSKYAASLLTGAFATNFSDGNPIIGTVHKNYLGVTGINATAALDAEKLMAEMLELGTTDALGLTPKYLLYAPWQRRYAFPILTPAAGQTNMIATADQTIGLEGIPVPSWTQSGTNGWFITASKDDIEMLNIGFFNGNEEPLAINEQSASGKNFEAKKTRTRYEFHYVGAVVDFRGIIGAKNS